LRLLIFILHGLVDEAADDRVVVERAEELLGCTCQLSDSTCAEVRSRHVRIMRRFREQSNSERVGVGWELTFAVVADLRELV
jgi:hypothetical protein